VASALVRKIKKEVREATILELLLGREGPVSPGKSLSFPSGGVTWT
jgi:hypothetical protein